MALMRNTTNFRHIQTVDKRHGRQVGEDHGSRADLERGQAKNGLAKATQMDAPKTKWYGRLIDKFFPSSLKMPSNANIAPNASYVGEARLIATHQKSIEQGFNYASENTLDRDDILSVLDEIDASFSG